ncbi:ClbS/DfsB family four-helix bundle protein [Paenibacillus taiwanensis]|uniref:ClbS/DfsB family four-helix bundle protein n=1 Tax=Paenibacillus taiwanensis TaxID=401638 RepID=UPI00040F906C|nr:ClbS/DfsB family four-helix bundle protein [Paenibacillus taiwanensis]
MASYDYRSREALKNAIHSTYLLLDQEFEDIDHHKKDVLVPEVDKTPAQIIAYQLGWLHLVMGWEKAERSNQEVLMPAPGYKWNQLGVLNRSFYAAYGSYSLHELRVLLQQTEQEWLCWVDELSEEELFTQGARKWTGEKPNWPLVRWIHINSVAPFRTFRAKLRKWKKYEH